MTLPGHTENPVGQRRAKRDLPTAATSGLTSFDLTYVSKDSVRRDGGRYGHRAFSMLETTIAVTILGVGLIMVAAIFPVALTQHKNNVEQASTMELLTKAQAMLHAQSDTSQLYTPVPLSDSPWYLLPTVNIWLGNTTWDPMLLGGAGPRNIYANLVSDLDRIYGPQPAVRTGNFPDYLLVAPDFPAIRQKFFTGLDVLSDRLAARPNDSFSPFTDAELQDVPNRYVWYGFYRRLANGEVKYAAAVCKQRRNDLYSRQDVSDFAIDTSLIPAAQTPFSKPIALPANYRLPVPWRISVQCSPAQHILANSGLAPLLPGSGSEGLGVLAPVGSKIMLVGGNSVSTGPTRPIPAGRILTVARAYYPNSYAVEVIEDLSDLPPFDDGNGNLSTFDVWLFPPAVTSGTASNVGFGKESPLMAWRANL